MTASIFFPLQNPFDEGYLDVGQGHRLWFAQYGNPDGIPLLWLHGGPGSASSPRHQIFADPSVYRLVLCDQRGCGRSTPAGGTSDNDTERLLQDINALRNALHHHCGLGKILLGGGSWGACLALAYAQRWPLTLLGLVLRAPFLAGNGDIDRFFQPKPEIEETAWQAFAGHVPSSERAQLLPYIAEQFSTGGPQVSILAQAWNRYEAIQDQPDLIVEANLDPVEVQKLVQRYRIQAHYLINHCFLNEADLLHGAASLGELPVAILQGKDDRICHPDNAIRLHARIAGSRLRMVVGAGHNPFHPGMATALLEALNCFALEGNFKKW